jgi:ribosomal protein S18 acetylase RimI-like enzyme
LASAPAVEIRTATRDDLEAIVELLRRDSITAAPIPPGLSAAQIEAFDTIAAHPDNEVIVATLGEEVIATMQLTFIPGLSFNGAWRAQVEGVRVRGDLRSRGIGASLMEWAIQRARDRGCRVVQLTSNHSRVDARRFYERLGFIASHTGMKLYL